jgi:hypothetical protein
MWSATQRRGKYTYTTIEGMCFLRGPCRAVILKTTGAAVVGAGYSPDCNDVSTEAGEHLLLRSATRKRLVKTLQRNIYC